MREKNCILITGGSGFIGSNYIRFLFGENDFSGKVVNVDFLTYAGNNNNLASVEEAHGGSRYSFRRVDITDIKALEAVFDEFDFDMVIHFAAESHVDRSITSPGGFIRTNIIGTFNLLELVRRRHEDGKKIHFHHVSTDEVYGSLGADGFFTEETPYDPRSPYSASKASSDHLVRAYHHTYNLPVTVSNCSNNYGPFQFPEKLIPLMILNMLEGKALPVYGDGSNVRDWLFVEDHCRAIHAIIENGADGATYNVGGDSELTNIDLVNILCDEMAVIKGTDVEQYKRLITFVKDRPGHDKRYAIDASLIKRELGWKPSVNFEDGILQTIRWYLDNMDWVDSVRSGEYQKWIDINYQSR